MSDWQSAAPPERILDLTSGLTMVVSDLHGDKDAFGRYIGRFLQQRTRKKVDRLLLLGDLIHREGPEDQDQSLPMLLDMIRMQRSLPPGSVVMLLGNHELPHLYDVPLSKGNIEYTPRFEQALSASGVRDEVRAFLNTLPFYVRTAAGVMFTHAGPDGNAMASIDMLRHLDHAAIVAEFDQALEINPHPEQLRALYSNMMGMPYEVLARYYLAVSGPDDPRYDHLIRSFMLSKESKEFEVLWDALFTRCEQGVPLPLYKRLLATFLEIFSQGAPAPQRFLVTGHITVQGGHKVVTEEHLRIASAAHARPREAGAYLLIDFGKPVDSVETLVQSLVHMF
ncbi:MAG: metallophosphoesterase [Chloroflexota bacterium]